MKLYCIVNEEAAAAVLDRGFIDQVHDEFESDPTRVFHAWMTRGTPPGPVTGVKLFNEYAIDVNFEKRPLLTIEIDIELTPEEIEDCELQFEGGVGTDEWIVPAALLNERGTAVKRLFEKDPTLQEWIEEATKKK